MAKYDDYPIEIRGQAIRLADQIGVAKAASTLGISAQAIYQWANHGVSGKKKSYSKAFKQAAIDQVNQKILIANSVGFFDTQADFKELRDDAIHQTATELGMRTAMLESWMPPIENVQGEVETLYPCACCGYLVYDEEPRYTSYICGICWWEADPVQEDMPEVAGGANSISLLLSRRNHFRAGAAETRYFFFKRHSPKPQEIPAQGNPFEEFYNSLIPEYDCPCCANRTFEAEPGWSLMVCPVCLWTDISVPANPPEDFPEWQPHYEIIALESARRNYAKFGVCDVRLLPFVRLPLIQIATEDDESSREESDE